MLINTALTRAITGMLRHEIQPEPAKELSRHIPIREPPMPRRLALSLAMHFGAPARPVVAKGDTVAFGQRVAEPGGAVSAAVHAPAAGIVADITSAVAPNGRMAQTILIDTAPSSCAPPFAAMDWRTASPAELLARVADAGVVGMGGAGFPTHVKLALPEGARVDTLILNGAECEPCLTADNRLMLERAADIWTGARIIRKILGAKKIRLAVEENKPHAIANLRKAMADAPEPDADAQIFVLHSSYPQGAEKRQIQVVTGRVVPSGRLPRDVRCAVDNVATAFAVFEAVALGLPLTRRVVTVSGDAINNPANLLVPNGTPFSDLVAFCGGAKPGLCKIIAGGPMMGFAQPDDSASTGKTTSGLLLLTRAATGCFTSAPCVSCGRCVDACPMRLMPCDIVLCAEAGDLQGAAALHILDCYECGACAWVCPARRPMVQHIRRAKAAINMMKSK